MEPLVHVDAQIHIHVHDDRKDRPSEVLQKLGDLATLVKQLQRGLSNMATKQDFNELVTAVNTATNNIATRIAALEAKIAAGGLTAEEEQGVLMELGSVRTALEALGADPNNPVPEPAPEQRRR
jgi:hypothetical protein